MNIFKFRGNFPIAGLMIFIALFIMATPTSTALANEGEPEFIENDCQCEHPGWIPINQFSEYHEDFEWMGGNFGCCVSQLHCEYSAGAENEPKLTLSIISTEDQRKLEELFRHFVRTRMPMREKCAANDACHVFDGKSDMDSQVYSFLSVIETDVPGPRHFEYTGSRSIISDDSHLVVISGWGNADDFESVEEFRDAFDILEQHAHELIATHSVGTEPEPQPEIEPESVPEADAESDSGGGVNVLAVIIPIVVVLAVAAGAAIFFMRRRRDSTTLPPAATSISSEPLVCPKCNYNGKPGEQFCQKCGREMKALERSSAPIQQEDTPSSELTCSECGTLNQDGAIFCKGCGSNLGD